MSKRRTPNSLAIFLERFKLQLGVVIEDGQRCGSVRGDGVVHHREGEIGAAHFAPFGAQAGEGLRRSAFVDQVAVNVYKSRVARALRGRRGRPRFFGKVFCQPYVSLVCILTLPQHIGQFGAASSVPRFRPKLTGIGQACGLGWRGVEDEAGRDVVLFGFGGELAVQGSEAVEEELGDVGEGYGVAAGDAFAGELFDEVAEEEVDGVGGGEVGEVAEEFGGVGVVFAELVFALETAVMSAKGRIGVRAEHAAVMTATI